MKLIEPYKRLPLLSGCVLAISILSGTVPVNAQEVDPEWP